MKKRRGFVVAILLLLGLLFAYRFFNEPSEVRDLRRQETVQTEKGHQEYYFKLLNEEEQRG